ncbi:hypothetical protein Tco_0093733 [Tanacetum coccineum]
MRMCTSMDVYSVVMAINFEVTCGEEAKRRNSGVKTKTFEETYHLLLYAVSNKEDMACVNRDRIVRRSVDLKDEEPPNKYENFNEKDQKVLTKSSYSAKLISTLKRCIMEITTSQEEVNLKLLRICCPSKCRHPYPSFEEQTRFKTLRMDDIEVDINKKTENQAKMTKLSMEWKRLCKIKAKAPEKVTGVDLFDLCSMDHETINVPHLLAKYLFRHAKGRKSEARLSGGHFIGRLAMHFGLVTDEGLRGLQGVTRELPLIDLHELGRLHICTRYGDTWTWVAQGPERQHVVAAGAPEVNEDGQGAEEVALEILAPALTQAPPPPPPAPQPCTILRIERLRRRLHLADFLHDSTYGHQWTDLSAIRQHPRRLAKAQIARTSSNSYAGPCYKRNRLKSIV